MSLALLRYLLEEWLGLEWPNQRPYRYITNASICNITMFKTHIEVKKINFSAVSSDKHNFVIFFSLVFMFSDFSSRTVNTLLKRLCLLCLDLLSLI